MCVCSHTHISLSTYSRHTVTNEHYWKHMDSRTHSNTHTPPPPSLTPSIFLCLSPPEDYSVGYLTPPLHKNVAWRSSTLNNNTTIHLPPSFCSLVAFSLFLFVSPHFSLSHVFSGATQMQHHNGKPNPLCLVSADCVTRAFGNSEV